ncbi:hypothetical protein J7E99_32360 [Streptomyces sp. ISL-44]|uniref:hypothetical protein n=1 Tax=Streptomyces sp. ISL-44 TaxID=2819184 RepID=UPI001BE6225D|nr:hypothetical protein [Streptomyces sp. ISL-44]MBT2545269.1 hypothetical protein [Streptomyces sp. ISL-44]
MTTQPLTSIAAPTGSRLWPVGPHLVIAPEEAEAALTAALGGLDPLPDAVLVLAAAPDAAPVLRRALRELVDLAAGRGAARLVLAASGLAVAGPDGRRPVEEVAAAARFPVIAPDGMVTVDPDGSLQVAPPGTWWLSEPGVPSRRLGPAWPPEVPEGGPDGEAVPDLLPDLLSGLETPEGPEEPSPDGGPAVQTPVAEPAEPAVDTEPEEPPPLAPPVPVVAESQDGGHGSGTDPIGVVLRSGPGHRPVPGGFWLGGVPEGVEALIGVRPGDLLLGVGSPQRPVLPAAELLDLVPEAAAERNGLLLSAPWAAPAELTAMAVALAARLGRDVRAAIGLPVRTADDYATSFLDERGAPAWQPLLVELTASPGHRRVVPSAWLRLPGLDALAPAVHRTGTKAWVLETVPAGLWLRPVGRSANPWPRMLHRDPARPVLVVGERDRDIAPEVWEALPDVLAALPDLGAAAPYGLLVQGNRADESATRAFATAHGLDWLGQTPAGPAPRRSAPGPTPDSARAPAAQPAPSPSPASTEAVPAPAALGPGGQSGPEDRAALKELLGQRYHLLASKTELLATRLPALRSTPQDDLKPDMVAIALYQADTPEPASRADLAAAARTAEPGPFTPLLRCLGSGLRRLPGHYGAVMLAAPAGEVPLDRYMPGSLLVEPAPVAAIAACDADLEGPVEFGIWSTTGRRTSVFAGPDAEPEVVFPPGTAFSVLALSPPDDDEGPIRVLLREISPAEAESAGHGTTPSGAADGRSRERDEQARARLTAWFERRDMLPPLERRPLPDPIRYHLAPGAG